MIQEMTADCLSRSGYPASECKTDVSARCNAAETAEANKNIAIERMIEEDKVQCLVVMAADDPLGGRVSRADHVLALEVAESDKQLFPESCLKDDWIANYAKSEGFESRDRAVTDPHNWQKCQEGLTEKDSKLCRNCKLLVPESRVLEFCEAGHHHMMHRRVTKRALDMRRRFKIDEIGIYNATTQVKKGCSVRQACCPDNQNVKEEAQWTFIPEQPMDSLVMAVICMESAPKKGSFRLCGPVCGPTQRLRCGCLSAQEGVASQGGCRHDDLSLADRLWLLL